MHIYIYIEIYDYTVGKVSVLNQSKLVKNRSKLVEKKFLTNWVSGKYLNENFDQPLSWSENMVELVEKLVRIFFKKIALVTGKFL